MHDPAAIDPKKRCGNLEAVAAAALPVGGWELTIALNPATLEDVAASPSLALPLAAGVCRLPALGTAGSTKIKAATMPLHMLLAVPALVARHTLPGCAPRGQVPST